MVEAALVAFGAVFLAELGDKSQLVTLGLATRYRPLPVLAGIAVACAVLQGMAVGVGAALSGALPERPLAIGAGALFVVMGTLALRPQTDDGAGAAPVRGGRSAAITAGSAFFVAELGDKTQLAALALASTNGLLGTWIGATTGELLADGLAVLAGALLGARLPARPLQLASAGVFVVVGVALVASAW